MLTVLKISILFFVINLSNTSSAQIDDSLFQPKETVAAKEVGNGGQSQGCYDKDHANEVSYTFFDIWEVRYLDKTWKPRSYENGSTYADILKSILEDLQELDPHRAEKYLKWATLFESEVNWVEDLQVTSDSITPIKDKNCPPHLRDQVIVQQPYPFYSRYDVKVAQWNLIGLDDNTLEFQRAVAILHEFIYRDIYLQGHRDTRHVRAFSTYLASLSFQSLIKEPSLSKDKKVSIYLGKAAKHHLGTYNYHGLKLLLPTATNPKAYENMVCPRDKSIYFLRIAGGIFKSRKNLKIVPLINSKIYFNCNTGRLQHFKVTAIQNGDTEEAEVFYQAEAEILSENCFALSNQPTMYFNEDRTIRFCW